MPIRWTEPDENTNPRPGPRPGPPNAENRGGLRFEGAHSDLVINDPIVRGYYGGIKVGIAALAMTAIGTVGSVLTPEWYGAPLAVVNIAIFAYNSHLVMRSIQRIGVRLFLAGQATGAADSPGKNNFMNVNS